MRVTTFHPSLVIVGWIAVVGVLLAMPVLRASRDHSKAASVLRIDRGRMSNLDLPATAQPTNVVLDDLRQKYAPARRVEFHVNSSKDTSVFVFGTGVQVHTPSGWQTAYEEYRGEIWRLKSGVAREVCVERPEGAAWRAYVRYGTEMKGAPLLEAQLKDAWVSRSFSNWTGKAWGGGRWSGAYELFSSEVAE